jgi:hypothetical protein
VSDLAETRQASNAALWETRLRQALAIARHGKTAIVVVPAGYPKDAAVTALVHLLEPGRDWNVNVEPAALHFSGTPGSVRIYSADHVTYDRRQHRLLDYPASVPTFLHPGVEEL